MTSMSEQKAMGRIEASRVEDIQHSIDDALRLHDQCVADYACRGASGIARLVGKLLGGLGWAPAKPSTLAH